MVLPSGTRLQMTFQDPDHSQEEQRNYHRYTPRRLSGIGFSLRARLATSSERRQYEQEPGGQNNDELWDEYDLFAIQVEAAQATTAALKNRRSR